MRWATAFFAGMDRFLCATFGGPDDATISATAARAELRGARWGCVLCWWLHRTLRQRHCMRTLTGEPMSGFAQGSAGVQLAVLFALIFYGVPALILRAW